MKNGKSRHGGNQGAKPPRQKKDSKDEAVMALIHGLDLFIAEASSADLGTVAR